jgi:hypothetical protein
MRLRSFSLLNARPRWPAQIVDTPWPTRAPSAHQISIVWQSSAFSRAIESKHDAPQIAHAPELALQTPNAEPEAVPSASDAERPMPDEDGTPLRIHYDSHNGYPFSAVGRVLIERNLIPREISMQRIREWMAAQSRGSTEAASHQPLVCVLPHNWVNERG